MGLFDTQQTTTSRTRTSSFEDLTNPFLERAIDQGFRISEQGFGDGIMNMLRSSARNRLGNQSSALRTSALNRLTRAGAPIQVQEQVLQDIQSRNEGSLSEMLTGLEFANARQKLQGLQLAGGLSRGLTRRVTTDSKGSSTTKGDDFSGLGALLEGGIGFLGGGDILGSLFGLLDDQSGERTSREAGSLLMDDLLGL